MTAKNDITGDLIRTRSSSSYADNYDAIFGKKKASNKAGEQHVKITKLMFDLIQMLDTDEQKEILEKLNIVYDDFLELKKLIK